MVRWWCVWSQAVPLMCSSIHHWLGPGIEVGLSIGCRYVICFVCGFSVWVYLIRHCLDLCNKSLLKS